MSTLYVFTVVRWKTTVLAKKMIKIILKIVMSFLEHTCTKYRMLVHSHSVSKFNYSLPVPFDYLSHAYVIVRHHAFSSWHRSSSASTKFSHVLSYVEKSRAPRLLLLDRNFCAEVAINIRYFSQYVVNLYFKKK